jgi:hypothetical protein
VPLAEEGELQLQLHTRHTKINQFSHEIAFLPMVPCDGTTTNETV